MATVAVVRTYLEMKSPGSLTGRASLPKDFAVKHESDPDLYRELYAGVGSSHHWRDRLPWTDDQIRAHLARPEISVWVLREGPAPRGFFELARQTDGSVEIVAEGEETSIRELHGWAQKGPSVARVDRVDTRWRSYSGEYSDFRIVD